MQELPKSTDRDLWLTWDQYHQLIEQLVLLIHESGEQFDHILCLARGGLRVGDVLSRVLKRPLSILAASSYRAASGTKQEVLSIAPFMTSAQGSLTGRVLVVDDLVDSGVTLAQVVLQLKSDCAAITEIRTAVIWHKAVSSFKPDFSVSYLASNPWIHQPFEVYDQLGPEDLPSLKV
jgi:hypoxanthine phosphoribosyltransferase